MFSLPMFVLHRSETFGPTTPRRTTACLFIHEMLSRDVGEEGDELAGDGNNIFLSVTMGDIPRVGVEET